MSDNSYDLIQKCALELANSKGEHTVILDVREVLDWTSYFIITTANSSVHLRGLLRICEDFTAKYGIHSMRKPSLDDEDEWCLIDYGEFIVHIMSNRTREFYDLESLWYKAKKQEVNPLV